MDGYAIGNAQGLRERGIFFAMINQLSMLNFNGLVLILLFHCAKFVLKRIRKGKIIVIDGIITIRSSL